MTSCRIVVALGLVLICSNVTCAQELAVRYRAEKSANPVGEPIFVSVELTNISRQTVRFDDGPCAQSFTPLVHVTPATSRLYGCSGAGSAWSCLGSFAALRPGEELSRRYLLPGGLAPNTPGDFEYQAGRHITFYATDGSFKPVGRQEITQTFTIHVTELKQSQVKSDYAQLLADLQSSDATKRLAALSAITQHPQPFLEPLILKLSRDPATAAVAITGLQKLRTDASKQRLAELTNSTNQESVRQQATTALAELDDGKYCDLMLSLVNARHGYTSDIAARGAGLLCGEKAIPPLLAALAQYPDTFPAYEIADALGNTGSRTAVPVLIRLLDNADDTTRRAVNDALYTLTHKSDVPLISNRQDWTAWWATEGKAAPIFSPTQCP